LQRLLLVSSCGGSWLTEIAVWKVEMSELPEGYKSLKPFLKIAEIMSEQDVAVEYWCLRYVYREAQNIDRTSPECTSFTSCLSSYFKKLEDENKVDQRFSSESVAHLYIQRKVYNMFQMADEIDRSERFSIDITTSFIIASNLITVLSVFGDIDARLIEVRKYARWRGAYVLSYLNDGKKPLSAPEKVKELLKQVRYHGSLSHGPCDSYDVYGIGQKIVVPLHYSNIHDDGASADLVLDLNNAHQFCKSAAFALQHEEIVDVIFNFERAYKIMKKYKKRWYFCREAVLVDKFMEDATVCFGIKDAVVSLSRSDVDEGSSESLYQCDEWTSKKGKREKKDKGYCYLHRLSSKEQLVHI
ncbi:Vacuolar protein sorting-associated protein VTA1 -like protein, partial [Trichinella pseudospiralis]